MEWNLIEKFRKRKIIRRSGFQSGVVFRLITCMAVSTSALRQEDFGLVKAQ
jgi:hypothetical protein